VLADHLSDGNQVVLAAAGAMKEKKRRRPGLRRGTIDVLESETSHEAWEA
jgi:hypothetical protein